MLACSSLLIEQAAAWEVNEWQEFGTLLGETVCLHGLGVELLGGGIAPWQDKLNIQTQTGGPNVS